MLEYKVTNNQRGAVIVQGDFAPGSVPVTIPDTNKKKKSFISLFLNKRDIERAIDFLNCISMNNHPIANEGLFISALAMFAKCFVNAEARNSLDKGRFKSFAPQFAESFDKYDAWRNKHFLHDENSMTEATAFLLVAPEGSESSLGGPPSVIWNSVQINYIEERKHLEMLPVLDGFSRFTGIFVSLGNFVIIKLRKGFYSRSLSIQRIAVHLNAGGYFGIEIYFCFFFLLS